MKHWFKYIFVSLVLALFITISYNYYQKDDTSKIETIHFSVSEIEDSNSLIDNYQSSPNYSFNFISNILQSSPAAAVEIKPNNFIFVDYEKIGLIDIKKNIYSELAIQGFDGELNPAGAFYEKITNRLVIANYTKKNVLIFNVDLENKKLVFFREIKNSSFEGPEGVFLEDNFLYVADYDSGYIYKFDLSKPDYILDEIWKQYVGSAHSITKLGNHIYATSLQHRKILKFTLEGKKTAETNGIGNIAPGHLWPTHLFETYEGNLGVIDPQQGTISVYNKDLSLIKTFGKNMPEPYGVNFPYMINKCNEGYVMANTFRQSFMILDRNFLKLYSIGWGQDNVIRGDYEIRKSKLNIPYVYDYIIDKSQAFIKALHINKISNINNIYAGFNGIVETNQKNIIKNYRIDSPNVKNFSSANNFYITITDKVEIDNKEYYIIFSPQSSKYFLIDPSTWASIIITSYRFDLWKIDDKFIQSNKENFENFHKLEKELESNPARIAVYNKYFPAYKDKNLFEKIFQHSTYPTTFSQSFLTGYTPLDFNEYIANIIKTSQRPLIEIVFASYLFNKPLFENLLDFDISSSTQFYSGNSIKKTKNYSDDSVYSASISNQDEYEIILNGDFGKGVLYIDWMKEALPKKLNITCYDAENLVIDIFKTNKINQINFLNPNFDKVKRIKIVLKDIDGHNRLLLRKIFYIKDFFDNAFYYAKQISNSYEVQLNSNEKPTIKEFEQGAPGHSGYFVYALAKKLNNKGYNIKAYDLKDDKGVIHSVVEAYDINKKFIGTFDPYLGLAYLDPVFSYIEYKDAADHTGQYIKLKEKINPAFEPYKLNIMAKNNIQIIRMYEMYDLNKLFRDYTRSP